MCAFLGQLRNIVLHVMKIQDNEVSIPYRCNHIYKWGKCLGHFISGLCGKVHERKDWQNNYVIFAENRPLNTLYQMVDTPDSQISFGREDFELQFNLYYRELKRLIEQDEECKNKVELFLYSDYTSNKTGNFSFNLKKKIRGMKMK